jgi:hypothetical protein
MAKKSMARLLRDGIIKFEMKLGNFVNARPPKHGRKARRGQNIRLDARYDAEHRR